MRFLRWARRWLLAVSAAILAYWWLFPQILFRDCVKPVFTEKPSAGEERALTEEDYIDVFHLEEDRYEIRWKFSQND